VRKRVPGFYLPHFLTEIDEYNHVLNQTAIPLSLKNASEIICQPIETKGTYFMINTKLILIDGVPCSGKSTIAKKLMVDISSCGIKCNCFLEWTEDNPIFIGKMEDLAEIISTTRSREQNVLQQWKDFIDSAKEQETVNIIESRFWQSSSMYLYLSGHSEYEVSESSNRVISVLAELNPVLIYLAPKDIEKLQARITMAKNEKWMESGRKGSWEQWGNDVYERQKWFTNRLLNSKAIPLFFNEWASIADRLYERLPFRKIKIRDPQVDWEHTLSSIRKFLDINLSGISDLPMTEDGKG